MSILEPKATEHMDLKSFFINLDESLDAIVEDDYSFENALDRVPSTASFSKSQRLELFRRFQTDRTDFNGRVDIETMMKRDGDKNSIEEVSRTKLQLITRILENSAGQTVLISEASAAIDQLEASTPDFEHLDRIRSDLHSTNIERIADSITHISLRTEIYRQAIIEGIAHPSGDREMQRIVFVDALTQFQAAKDVMIGQWIPATLLIALHYVRGVPARELAIAGVFGLARAVEKFDSRRGIEFGVYASWWIRQAVTKAVVELRGWTVNEIELRSQMKKLLGNRWKQWIQSPDPEDVRELGLSDQEGFAIIERMHDTKLYPVEMFGRHLTPDCAGVEHEPVELSEYIVSATHPIWFV